MNPERPEYSTIEKTARNPEGSQPEFRLKQKAAQN